MAATNTTVTITNAYTQLNSAAAAGGVSVFPIGCTIWLNVSASTTAPTSDAGAILVGPSEAGNGMVNQTLAAIWPGFTSPAYLFARTTAPSTGGAVAVSCA